jgi:hypothetical protein
MGLLCCHLVVLLVGLHNRSGVLLEDWVQRCGATILGQEYSNYLSGSKIGSVGDSYTVGYTQHLIQHPSTE